MKTMDFLKGKMRIAVILLVSIAAIIVGLSSFNIQHDAHPANGLAQQNEVKNVVRRLNHINKDIAQLEQQRAKLEVALQKAVADRDANHGMVAGLYFQPAQDLSEVNYLKGKMKQVDAEISSLKQEHRVITQKYGIKIHKMEVQQPTAG